MQTNPYDIRNQLGYPAKITKDLLNKTVRRIAVDLGCSPQAIYRRLYQSIKERPVYDGHGIDVVGRQKARYSCGFRTFRDCLRNSTGDLST